MDRLEARIRDYLAKRLDLIEPALILVGKEFRLTNAAGAGGSVDILAKDRFGHYVVIEIKRSDQTAREALHELTKYVALLKSTLGIRIEQIRAVLLSTDWHELAVPFAEYQRVCEAPTEGFVLIATADGVVTSVEPFKRPVMGKPLRISREQLLCLYVREESRDAVIPSIAAAARRASLTDFAILCIDYQGKSEEVMYPYGVWMVFSSPLAGMTLDEATRLKATLDWDDELEDENENFLVAMGLGVQFQCDSAEAGYPEKLASLGSRGWRIRVAQREGRYDANRHLVSDEALIAEAAMREGGANCYLDRTASPRYAPSWKRFKEDANLVLLGNPAWSRIFRLITDDVERNHRKATVSAHVYNPANIVLTLAKLFAESEHG